MLRRVGLRQCPEMCWHLAKRTANAVNQGGTANVWIRPWQRVTSVEGFFLAEENRTPIGFHGLLAANTA